MEIRLYKEERDAEKLKVIIELEGDWDYSKEELWDKYLINLKKSITLVAYESGEICGFSRSLEDYGFYIYVCDLLVTPKFRGRSIGKRLMEKLHELYEGYTVYVMSDVDGYYSKLGYEREGSIFEVNR